MKQENVLKAILMLGGGLLLFMLVKPKGTKAKEPSTDEKKSFDSKEKYPTPDPANAEIVAEAYSSALQAGESTQKLNELNKECMKDYGMRCYMDKFGKLIVCDVSGSVILSR